MSIFKKLIKQLDDKNTSLLDDAVGAAEFTGFLDTGCLMLNAQLSGSLYGGVPNNKITGFAGLQSVGKTFFVLAVVSNFLKDNPEGGVIFYDTEASVTKKMMESRGIDPTRVIVGEPATIQQFRHQAITFLDKYMEIPESERPPMIMVLDSLGMLSSTKELEDTQSGAETKDMTKPGVIKAAFRVLTLKAARAKIPVLVTNHLYAVIGAYVPTNEMSGGTGLKFAASTIASITKKKDKEGTEVVGNLLTVKMLKSRLSKENTEITIRLSYKTGLDKYYGLLDLAEKYGIFKKVSTRYELPDGTKEFGKTINNNPEQYYTPEIMERLEKAANVEFQYGGNIMDDEEETETE